MAVTITSPQSKVVARGTATLSWTCQYPQTSYEIQYRQAGQSAWSTFGQVSGAATSVTLNLSVFEDFGLYHYRVVSYASNATSGTSTYNGSDFSAAYAIMVVPANQVATMKIKYGSGMEEVPLYSTTNRFPKLVTDQGQNPLLADTDYAAGHTKARVGSTTRAVAVPPSSLPATGQAAYAYMTQNYRYSQSYSTRYNGSSSYVSGYRTTYGYGYRQYSYNTRYEYYYRRAYSYYTYKEVSYMRYLYSFTYTGGIHSYKYYYSYRAANGHYYYRYRINDTETVTTYGYYRRYGYYRYYTTTYSTVYGYYYYTYYRYAYRYAYGTTTRYV